jgi:hypothetical protein
MFSLTLKHIYSLIIYISTSYCWLWCQRTSQMSANFKCRQCQQQFFCKTEIDSHLRSSHPLPEQRAQRQQRSFKCRQCERQFQSKEDVDQHLRRLHPFRNGQPTNDRSNCASCGVQIMHSKGVHYYRSNSTVGSKGDWDHIAKVAQSADSCGACHLHNRPCSPHRSLDIASHETYWSWGYW